MTMPTVLIAEDDSLSRSLYRRALDQQGYHVYEVGDGEAALEVIQREPIDVLIADVLMPRMNGLELIEKARVHRPTLKTIVMTANRTPETILRALRNQACDFLSKPFTVEELYDAVQTCLDRPPQCFIEVISAKEDWIELRVPCDLNAVEPINKFLIELQSHLPQETREAIGSVFRELLNNAIEHGGKCDPAQRVEVKYIRLKRAILYSIKDPGEGFRLDQIEHAAFANPTDNPMKHMEVRQQKGLRPGGFGIMLASQAVDELIYNEKHNELIFVKYLPESEEEA